MTENNPPTNENKIKWLVDIINHNKRLSVFAVCFLIIMSFVLYSFIFRHFETTDNAVVRCDKIDVISEVPGILRDVYVSDNTYYQKGSLLAKIDDNVLSSEQKQAESELKLAEAILQSARSNEELVKITQKSNGVIALASVDASTYEKESVSKQIAELKSELSAAQETLDQARRNLEQEEKLIENKLISTRQLDETRLKYRVALAERDGIASKLESTRALEKVRQAEIIQSRENHSTHEEVNRIRIDQAKARTLDSLANMNLAREKLQHASIMLDKTNIVAMRSGYVTNTRIFKGDFVEIGQPIASIISCGESAWIEANFKETQITKMTIGQKSEFRIDTYPDTVITGTVEGLSYGSGATFSVLPPENAVGNYTKVVQRFPVRIRINQSEGIDLRAGMSAVVKVYTKNL